jgi:hypothetical protein
MIRTWVLWDLDRRVAFFLGLLWIGVSAMSIGWIVEFTKTVTGNAFGCEASGYRMLMFSDCSHRYALPWIYRLHIARRDSDIYKLLRISCR